MAHSVDVWEFSEQIADVWPLFGFVIQMKSLLVLLKLKMYDDGSENILQKRTEKYS